MAIRTHISLEYKLRSAAMEGDLGQIRDAAEKADEADLIRADFREAVRNHEEKARKNNRSGFGDFLANYAKM